ncbi:MAG: winged helix-turn-helix domain-containing protein [Candidatus Nitrosopolaris sp.]
MDILSLLEDKPDLRSTEMSADLKLDKRTIHRHLTPLEREGFVIGTYLQTFRYRQTVTIKKYELLFVASGGDV